MYREETYALLTYLLTYLHTYRLYPKGGNHTWDRTNAAEAEESDPEGRCVVLSELEGKVMSSELKGRIMLSELEERRVAALSRAVERSTIASALRSTARSADARSNRADCKGAPREESWSSAAVKLSSPWGGDNRIAIT